MSSDNDIIARWNEFKITHRNVANYLSQHLLKDEGIRYEPYLDSEGNWTVGVGHRCVNGEEHERWDEYRVMRRFELDMAVALDDYGAVFPMMEVCDQVRQSGLMEFLFVFGRDKAIHQFPRFIDSMRMYHWGGAIELLQGSDPRENSKWLDQAPKRARMIFSRIAYGLAYEMQCDVYTKRNTPRGVKGDLS